MDVPGAEDERSACCRVARTLIVPVRRCTVRQDEHGARPCNGPCPSFAVPGPADELSELKSQAAYFESELENTRKRIESLESKTEPE